MGSLSAATAIIAVVLPHAGALGLLGAVPMGLLAYRYRIRVLVAATVAASVIGFLVVGVSGVGAVALCAHVGGLGGFVKRRHRGMPTVIAVSFAAGVVIGAAAVIALTVLARLRELMFQAMSAALDGGVTVLTRVPHLRAAAQGFQTLFIEALAYWQWLVLAYSVVATMGASLIGWWALCWVLERLGGIGDGHKLDATAEVGPIQPVPMRLDEVCLRYPDAEHDALRPVSLNVGPAEYVAVTGANGAGKTTLMLILAGRKPTSGSIERPGAVGLGQLGGTAVVMQHPESQVLGMQVADDVVWGLPPGKTTDIDRLLGEVGLYGFAERDTGSLSGGELQRLAVAAALAREPALLIADEVTSMVDQHGRDALLAVLSSLTARYQTAVVHITHYHNEAQHADRTKFQAARLQLMRGRVDLEVASAGGFSPDDHTRVAAALAAVGLDPALANRRIDQLSGGQMRRVVLAGLLARSPRVLILDEPLAGLDAASARGLVRLLADRRRETGLTVVVISHDFAGLEELCPRTLHLCAGRLNPAGAPGLESVDGTGLLGIAAVPTPAHRPSRPVVLLRPVPGHSAIHQLWAGTKLLVAFSMSMLLTLSPGWLAIGLAAVLVLVGMRVARIPRGVLPSPPRGLWIVLVIGGATAALAGGGPQIQAGVVTLHLGGLLEFLRFTALSIVLLGMGALVSWTTHVADIAPAVATLGRPLRALRIPIDDWSVALALALRTFPMLIDEFRVLHAARRLRPKDVGPKRGAGIRRLASEVIDLVVAIISVTLRRADEMGDAITARGGTGQISAVPSRPQRADWVALVLVSAVCAAVLTTAPLWGV